MSRAEGVSGERGEQPADLPALHGVLQRRAELGSGSSAPIWLVGFWSPVAKSGARNWPSLNRRGTSNFGQFQFSQENSLPEFMNFKLFGKTILVAIKFELFWAIHSASEKRSLRGSGWVRLGFLL